MAVARCVATAFERRRPLPVDAMIPDALFTSTHAITIDAPPEQVWPWIAQMGAGRAGWYSWDAIDNGGTLMFLAIGFGATAFGRRFRFYSIATIVVLLAFGVLTFLEAPRLQANLPTRWIGLWERINISAFLLWVVMLGAGLWRAGTPQGDAS